MKKYFEPYLSLSYFRDEDVLNASVGSGGNTVPGDNDLPWVDV